MITTIELEKGITPKQYQAVVQLLKTIDIQVKIEENSVEITPETDAFSR